MSHIRQTQFTACNVNSITGKVGGLKATLIIKRLLLNETHCLVRDYKLIE